jgi:glycosyltransferase involved in cell wall biosynthesis
MKLKLIKLDVIHPAAYLQDKKKEWTDLSELTAAEYRDRLIRLRSNYSDFYTYHLNQKYDWEAEEYFLMDDDFTEKIAKELFGPFYRFRKFWNGSRYKIKYSRHKWERYVLDQYIRKREFNVIFARSQPLPSQWFSRFYRETLLVARLSARLPFNWHPNHWDLIYTDQPDFQHFFELHGVKTILNDQGFDRRIVKELEQCDKRYEVTFVGGLGTENFSKRTYFLNDLLDKIDVKWWGYWWSYGRDWSKLSDFPKLEAIFQGSTSGLEMFQIYKDSKIVLNDYVDTANGIGFNQRMFEVMGCGGFMLTRDAPNFEDTFPSGIFATYKDEKDLLEKITYYLENEKEREAIAKKGQEFVLENFDYENIVDDFSADIKEAMAAKKKLLDRTPKVS